MEIRKRWLPSGWYPDSAAACRQDIEAFQAGFKELDLGDAEVHGGIVPHAGWYFSGKLAGMVFYASSRGNPPETVAVIGGHLGSGAGLLYFDQDWDTPLGRIEIDKDLYRALKYAAGLRIKGPDPRDNTGEIQSPR